MKLFCVAFLSISASHENGARDCVTVPNFVFLLPCQCGQQTTRIDTTLVLVLVVCVTASLTQPQHQHQPSLERLHDTHARQDSTSTTVSSSVAAGRRALAANLTCGNIQEAVMDAEILCDLIDAMKDNYTLYEFGASWDTVDQLIIESRDNTSLQICDENGGHCMFVLPNLPPSPYTPPPSQQGLKLMLVTVLGYVQRYTVAFETLLLDQTLQEDFFVSQMAAIHANLEDLIDSFIATVLLCELHPDQHLIQDLSVRMYRGGDSVLRTNRGFRVLRQARKGLKFIIDVFGSCSPVPKS